MTANARAFLFAAEEDFGMSPVEAMALGTPVIGFGKGGTRDYIQPGVNGCFFPEQTTESLSRAVREFEETAFDGENVRESVGQFDEKHFRQQIASFVEQKLREHGIEK